MSAFLPTTLIVNRKKIPLMSTKEKKHLARIIVGLVVFIVVYFLPIDSWFEQPNALYIEFALFLIPYLIVGYDVIGKPTWIWTGQVFDENFLMCVATIGAFALVFFPEPNRIWPKAQP